MVPVCCNWPGRGPVAGLFLLRLQLNRDKQRKSGVVTVFGPLSLRVDECAVTRYENVLTSDSFISLLIMYRCLRSLLSVTN